MKRSNQSDCASRRCARVLLSITVALLCVAPPIEAARPDPAAPVTPDSARVLFIENTGQFDPAVLYQAWGDGQTFWLAQDAIWVTDVVLAPVQQPLPEGAPSEGATNDGRARSTQARVGIAARLAFTGANPAAVVEPFDRLDVRVSYFLGRDPNGWRPDVPVWGGVRYRQLYPGLDLEVTGAGGEWQWRLLPSEAAESESPRAAAMTAQDSGLRIEGPEAVTVDGNVLHLAVSPGELTVPLLAATSETGTRRVLPVAPGLADVVGSVSAGQAPGGAVTAAVEPSMDLVYGAYLGRDSTGNGIALDGQGNAYIAGATGSPRFPSTPGAFDPDANGAVDAFVLKLDPVGRQLLFATFLGGGSTDYGLALALDGASSVYVAGQTYSPDLAVTPGAYDTTSNGANAFVAKLDSTGSRLVYSTYLGGSGREEGAALAVDATGAAYVAGATTSRDFPVTAGSFDPTFNDGYTDAFVAKLDPAGSALEYATFLGGKRQDRAAAVAVDGTGAAYVAGATMSKDFPTTPGAFYTGHKGGIWDAFAVKVAPDGGALSYGTYLGGSQDDEARGIAVDAYGSAYLTGYTRSANFPTTPGAYDPTHSGVVLADAFVTKLASTGSRLIYSTYVGGYAHDEGWAIAIDRIGCAYIAGQSSSTDFPTTPGALRRSLWEDPDAFLVKLGPGGDALVYAATPGGEQYEAARAVAIDASGGAVITGYTDSREFPVTRGAFRTVFAGMGSNAFVLKLATPVPPALVGAVWHDLNGDGVRDAGEPGIPGVEVCAEPFAHFAARCTTTAANGFYTLNLPVYGTFLVMPSQAPSGLAPRPGFRVADVGPQGVAADVDFGYR